MLCIRVMSSKKCTEYGEFSIAQTHSMGYVLGRNIYAASLSVSAYLLYSCCREAVRRSIERGYL